MTDRPDSTEALAIQTMRDTAALAFRYKQELDAIKKPASSRRVEQAELATHEAEEALQALATRLREAIGQTMMGMTLRNRLNEIIDDLVPRKDSLSDFLAREQTPLGNNVLNTEAQLHRCGPCP